MDPRQTDCPPLKRGRGGDLSQHTTQVVQVSRLLSAILDVQRRHLFRIPYFQLTKTTPDTQSLMCSHEYQEREEQTSALLGRLETGQRCRVDRVSVGAHGGGAKQASTIPAEQPSRHTEKQTSLSVGVNQSRERSPGNTIHRSIHRGRPPPEPRVDTSVRLMTLEDKRPWHMHCSRLGLGTRNQL